MDNNQRDGAMPVKQNNHHINFEPNRYMDTPKEAPEFNDPATPLHGSAGRQKIEKTNDFGQAGQVYNRCSDEEKAALLRNLAGDLKHAAEPTQLRAVCNFYRADATLGQKLADALQVDITPYLQHMGVKA